jgi:hypothetical protein
MQGGVSIMVDAVDTDAFFHEIVLAENKNIP